MLIGSLALAGFPFFSGFFSKDEIIHHALSVHPILGVMGLITALMTAFYTFRMVFLAFFGEQRVPEGVHAHESGKWMLIPLVILSFGAIGAGYLGIDATHKPFHNFLAPVFDSTFAANNPVAHGAAATVAAAGHGHEAAEQVSFWTHYGLMVLSGFLSIAGIYVAFQLYVKRPWLAGLLKATAPGLHRTLWNKWYVDEAYDASIVQPLKTGGRVAVGLDDYLIDGLLWTLTAVPRALGYLARVPQSGLLQGYGLSMVVGVTIIVLIMLWA